MSFAFNGNQVARLAGQQPFPLGGVSDASLFPPSSRYHGLSVLQYQQEDGRSIAYLERRFLPDPSAFEDLTEYAVIAGDRLDNIAYRILGDAEQYWRICDSNPSEMQPENLTVEVGRRIRITLPEGIPGATPRA